MPVSISCVKMLNFLDRNDAFVSGMSPSFSREEILALVWHYEIQFLFTFLFQISFLLYFVLL